MNDEVRYHMLRPGQIVDRRKKCPVAYIPIGTIEWHGVHNPLGADTLQAEGIAVRCAQKGGGLVFPSLYYGENRLESLMEANSKDRDLIAREMKLPPENFKPDRMPFSVEEQSANYQKLLTHILTEVETLGFEVGVIVAGHYPLIDHARAAVLRFNRREFTLRHNGMLAWAFVDYLLVSDLYDCAGDHAGGWETSHLMALHPETVDIGSLPHGNKKMVGINGKMDPRDSTAGFGRETIEKAVELAVKEAQHRLEHRDLYVNPGMCLKEGLWRNEPLRT